MSEGRKHLKVGQEFRTHNLSNSPGGVIVIVVEDQQNGLGYCEYEYDRVKNPEAYIKAVLRKELVKDAYVKGTQLN